MLVLLAACAGRGGSDPTDEPSPHEQYVVECTGMAAEPFHCIDPATLELWKNEATYGCVSPAGHLVFDGQPECRGVMPTCRSFDSPGAVLDVVCCPPDVDCF